MNKFVGFVLMIVLILSLSVFSFASVELVPVDPSDPAYGVELTEEDIGFRPYALIPASTNPIIHSARVGSSDNTWVTLINEDDKFIGSGADLTYIGTNQSDWQRAVYIGSYEEVPVNTANYWWNFIGKITDANGYVLQASDFDYFCAFTLNPNNGRFGSNQGNVTPATDNIYQFEDGYLQICFSANKWNFGGMSYALGFNVSNTDVVAPLSFEVETFDFYNSEPSTTAYPFTFGSGAHTVVPDVPVPKDPNDHTQYGTASDQVEWFNDAYGSAVNPELNDKISGATGMLEQEQEIEDDVIAGMEQYSSSVDPAVLTFPTGVLSGMSFIGTTFMSSYNNLGDISFVISLSMMIGVVMVIIGRGEGALARGMSASARERRRTEFASERDLRKGG